MNLSIPLHRGKLKYQNDWAYGYFCYGDLSDQPCIQQASDHRFRIVELDTISMSSGVCDCKRTEEYPEGQMIYEGDIIEFVTHDQIVSDGSVKKVCDVRTMLVIQDKDSFYMVELYRIYRSEDNSDLSPKLYGHKGSRRMGVYESDESFWVNVVGNKWDNPDLLS